VGTPLPSGVAFALKLVARLMRHEELTVDQAVDKSGFDAETARRYLVGIQRFIPGIRRRGRGRQHTYALDASDQVTPTVRAVLALRLAQALLAVLRGSELERELRELVASHQGRLRPEARPPPDLSRMFVVRSAMMRPRGIDGATFDLTVAALLSQNRFRADYTNFEGVTRTIEFEPYTIVFSDHGLHCYGRLVQSESATRSEPRLLALERLRNVAILERGFVYPDADQYRPDDVFEHLWGLFLPLSEDAAVETIELAFAGRWKAFLQRHRWHDHQAAPTDLPDGRVLVTFRLCPTHDFIQWVRGQGKTIEVLGPVHVREWVESGVDP
jgi:predicted DNA-binding transcriptional regulator YafY